MKVKLLAVILGVALLLGLGFGLEAQSPEDDFLFDPALTLPEDLGSVPSGIGPGRGPGRGQMRAGPGMGPGMGYGMGFGMGYGMQNQRQMARQMYLERMKKTDPKRYERILKIRDLAPEYGNTDNPTRKAQIEKELRPLIDAELKAQQADAKKRLADLEKRLARMKEILKQREEHWNEVVDHNLKKITGQLDYLNFPPVAPPEPVEPRK